MNMFQGYCDAYPLFKKCIHKPISRCRAVMEEENEEPQCVRVGRQSQEGKETRTISALLFGFHGLNYFSFLILCKEELICF
jgi:hypothetical protein